METLSPEKQERDRLIAEARRLLEEVVAFGAALPPEARLVPRTPEGWSVTDHLTHLAAWHRWLREELHGRPGAPELGFTAEEFAPLFPQFDPINARIHETFAGTSWDDAVISLRASHADLETILKRATSEELRSPALWADSLTTIYHNFTLHHVGEHLGWMREQVAATSPV
jgi:hypothetical protein